MRCSGDARAERVRPLVRSLCSTNASIGLTSRRGSWPVVWSVVWPNVWSVVWLGISGATSGLSDHQSIGSDAMGWSCRSSNAPRWIQVRRVWISCGASFLSGIFKSGSKCSTARIKRLASGFPGRIAGPLDPPVSHPLLESRANPFSIWPAW